MRRIVSLLIVTLIFSTTLYAQGSKVTPRPKASVTLTEEESGAVRGLLGTLLFYIDRGTRSGCAERWHPNYFPHWPAIVLSYKGRAINWRQWEELVSEARFSAPAVRLLRPDERVPKAYTIDILQIKDVKPFSIVKYKHSSRFIFAEPESQPWFGPEFDPPKRTLSLVVSEAKVYQETAYAFSPGRLTTLALGNERGLREIKDQAVVESVMKAVADFHAKRGEKGLEKTEFLRYFSTTVEKYSGLDDAEVEVVYATATASSGFVGASFSYLLGKKEGVWEVVDGKIETFSDVILSTTCSRR